MDKKLIFWGISFVAHMEVDYVQVHGNAFIGRIKVKPLRVNPYYYGVIRIYNVSWFPSKLRIRKSVI